MTRPQKWLINNQSLWHLPALVCNKRICIIPGKQHISGRKDVCSWDAVLFSEIPAMIKAKTKMSRYINCEVLSTHKLCVSEKNIRSENWTSYHLQTEVKIVGWRSEKKIKQGQRDKDLTRFDGSKNTWLAKVMNLAFIFISQTKDQLNVKQVFQVEHDLTCPEPEGWSRTGWEVSQGWTPASDLQEQTFPHLKKTKWGFLWWKTNQFSLQSNVWQKNLIWKCHSPSVWSSASGLAVLQRFLSGFFIPILFVPKNHWLWNVTKIS